MKFSTAAVLASAAAGAHASYGYGKSDSSAPYEGYGSGFGVGAGVGSHAPADVATTPAGTGSGKITYITQVVESFVTFCPGPTELVHNDKTYTITEATTFTISDCPCTVTSPSGPFATGSGSSTSGSSPIAGSGSGIAKVGTAYSTQTQKAAPYATGAVYGGSASSTGIVSAVSSSAPTASVPPVSTSGLAMTNGAGKVAALSGAAIVGVLGVAAFLL